MHIAIISIFSGARGEMFVYQRQFYYIWNGNRSPGKNRLLHSIILIIPNKWHTQCTPQSIQYNNVNLTVFSLSSQYDMHGFLYGKRWLIVIVFVWLHFNSMIFSSLRHILYESLSFLSACGATFKRNVCKQNSDRKREKHVRNRH